MDSLRVSDSEMQSHFSDSPLVPSASSFSSKPLPPKKWLVPMLILVVLVLGLFSLVTLSNRNENQELRSKAAGRDVGVVLSTTPLTVTPNGTVDTWVDVTLPTATTNQLSAVDIYVTYPANLLSVVSVQPGPLFVQNHDATTEMLNITKTDVPGEIRIVLGSPCKKDPPYALSSCTKVNTTTRAATIRFRALASGTATIAVSTTKTQIASIDSSTSVYNTTPSTNVITIQTAQGNKRDVSGPTLGVPDGQVDGRDLGYILRTPFPCGGIFAACPSNPAGQSSRDVSGPTLGVPDGQVDGRDLGYILRTPFPCGGIFTACQ